MVLGIHFVVIDFCKNNLHYPLQAAVLWKYRNSFEKNASSLFYLKCYCSLCYVGGWGSRVLKFWSRYGFTCFIALWVILSNIFFWAASLLDDALAVLGLVAILALSWSSTAAATKVARETGTLEGLANIKSVNGGKHEKMIFVVKVLDGCSQDKFFFETRLGSSSGRSNLRVLKAMSSLKHQNMVLAVKMILDFMFGREHVTIPGSHQRTPRNLHHWCNGSHSFGSLQKHSVYGI